jgi:hypothetical protein
MDTDMALARVPSARRVFFPDQPRSTDEQARLEKLFYTNISLPNGTHKTTAQGRLTDLDLSIQKLLRAGGEVRLLDVGISSGVTTLELIDHIERAGCRATGIGADLKIHTFLRSVVGVDLLFDSEGKILQLATPLFARGRPDRSRKTIASKCLRLALDILERKVVRRWVAEPGRALPLALVSRRLTQRSGFDVVECDISQPRPEWLDSFDLIRAANVLNVSSFSPAQISVVVKNLTSWLRVGGLLSVCRTHAGNGKNHGSIFVKVGQPPLLQVVERLGDGSEIEPIALEAV